MMSNPSLPQIPEPSWPMQELAELTRAAATLLGASRVWLALADRKAIIAPRIAVSVEHGTPVPSDLQSFQAFTEAIISVLYQRRSLDPVILPDLQRAPELLRTIEPGATPPRAMASVALVSEGKMIGALIATNDHPGGFSDGVRQPLNMLAGMAIMTIRMSADRNRNAAQADELSALFNAARALTSSLESRDVFQAIIESVKGVIACDSALIYHYEDWATQLRVVASIGHGPDALEGATIPLDAPSSKAAWVARRKQNYIGIVGPEDETGAHTDALRTSATFSLLCVPLISKDQLRGVASLARRNGFTTREVNAMERFGAIAAAALENMDLFNLSQAAREQQQALFRAASDGFAVVDAQRRFIRVNPAFAGYVSTHPDTLMGQVCCQTFSQTPGVAEAGPATCRLCQGEPECLIRQVMQSRTVRENIECVVPSLGPTAMSEPTMGARSSSGPQPMNRVIDFSLSATTGADGNPRVLIVGRDVTGPREMQRYRAQHMQMISHEVATPLHSIRGVIDYILTYGRQKLDPEHARMLDTAHATAISMDALIGDIDLISRKDAGELRIEPRPSDITEEVREATSEMSVVAQEQGVALYPHLEPNAPLAMADPARVRQVARNLISNAVKFTPSGGEVHVIVRSDANWVTLQVQDTGMGIAAEDIDKIWWRSYQTEQAKSMKARGRGLGLAIVRIIVDAHHGKYHAQSVVGRGTLFTTAFPRADHASQR